MKMEPLYLGRFVDLAGEGNPSGYLRVHKWGNMRPQPIRAGFTPRNERVLKALECDAQEAKERLKKWDGETKVNIKDFFPAK